MIAVATPAPSVMCGRPPDRKKNRATMTGERVGAVMCTGF
jgi:hypothetical protein